VAGDPTVLTVCITTGVILELKVFTTPVGVPAPDGLCFTGWLAGLGYNNKPHREKVPGSTCSGLCKPFDSSPRAPESVEFVPTSPWWTGLDVDDLYDL